jgi:hypothetical protein
MGGARSTHWEDGSFMQNFKTKTYRELRYRHSCEDNNIRTDHKGRCTLDPTGSEWSVVEGNSEYGDEIFFSIKGGHFLTNLANIIFSTKHMNMELVKYDIKAVMN